MSELPKEPQSRLEKQLHAIATGEGDLPKPLSRTEVYLDYIAKNGIPGSGGTVSIEDSLGSTSKVKALSANQGKVLDGKITVLSDNFEKTNSKFESIYNDGERISKYNPFANDTHDDNLAFEECINNSNGIVLLQPGKKYLIDNPLEISKSITIIGNKNNLIAKNPDAKIFNGNEVSLIGSIDCVNVENSSFCDDVKRTIETTSSYFTNTKGSTKGVMDIANYAGQGLSNSQAPKGIIYHHYSDGDMLRLDNVGSGNTILTLNNAWNPNRRTDKGENFVGNGNYIKCLRYNLSLKQYEEIFKIDSLFNWFVKTGKTFEIFQNKSDTNTWGFGLKCNTAHEHYITLSNGSSTLARFMHSDNFTRAVVDIPPNNTNGLRIVSNSGDVEINTNNGALKSNNKYVQLLQGGSTNNRPSNPPNFFQYCDTTIIKTVWFYPDGTWRDAMGAIV